MPALRSNSLQLTATAALADLQRKNRHPVLETRGYRASSSGMSAGVRPVQKHLARIWTEIRQAALFAAPISLQVPYPSLQPVCHWLCSDDCHSTCFLAGASILSQFISNLASPSPARRGSAEVVGIAQAS
jgi:hypothetical protein